jgi:protein-L-isoaspartate(D-aspartate) O-methyltransferase
MVINATETSGANEAILRAQAVVARRFGTGDRPKIETAPGQNERRAAPRSSPARVSHGRADVSRWVSRGVGVLEGHERNPRPSEASVQLARYLAEAGITDPRVLDAAATVPRELFVPRPLRRAAALDVPLPIGEGQTISAPYVVAHMCELLEPSDDDRVLDVGTGSGYHAALLSRLARHVWSIEISPTLSRRAAAALEAAGIENVTLLVGDGGRGHPEAAPYAAINAAAAAAYSVPQALEEQLASGGRLIAPVGRGEQRLVRARRIGEHVEREYLDRVRFVPLRRIAR